MFVYGPVAPSTVLLLHRMGLSRKAIAHLTGISLRTISHWCRTGPPAGLCSDVGARHRPGPKRQTPTSREDLLAGADLAAYAYLLGLYLGDGHIAENRREVYALRIAMDSRYPGIIGETVRAVRRFFPETVRTSSNILGTTPFTSSVPQRRGQCSFPSMARGESTRARSSSSRGSGQSSSSTRRS
jgi:hypothetical protein